MLKLDIALSMTRKWIQKMKILREGRAEYQARTCEGILLLDLSESESDTTKLLWERMTKDVTRHTLTNVQEGILERWASACFRASPCAWYYCTTEILAECITSLEGAVRMHESLGGEDAKLLMHLPETYSFPEVCCAVGQTYLMMALRHAHLGDVGVNSDNCQFLSKAEHMLHKVLVSARSPADHLGSCHDQLLMIAYVEHARLSYFRGNVEEAIRMMEAYLDHAVSEEEYKSLCDGCSQMHRGVKMSVCGKCKVTRYCEMSVQQGNQKGR
jgi:hypothetical protein